MIWNNILSAYRGWIQPVFIYSIITLLIILILVCLAYVVMIIFVTYRQIKANVKNNQDKHFKQELDKVLNILSLSVVTVSFLLVAIYNNLIQFYICFAIITGIWLLLFVSVSLKNMLLTWWKSRGD